MDTNIPKDDNTNCTIISRVLDFVNEKLKGEVMLRTLIVGADITTRESKNQFFAAHTATCVALEQFKATQAELMRMGHTHDGQDQRFSSVGTALSRDYTLEKPSDCESYMEQYVKLVRGRQHSRDLQGHDRHSGLNDRPQDQGDGARRSSV